MVCSLGVEGKDDGEVGETVSTYMPEQNLPLQNLKSS